MVNPLGARSVFRYADGRRRHLRRESLHSLRRIVPTTMKTPLATLAFLLTLAADAPAANPPAKASPPITAKDVRTLPYSREFEKVSLDGKRGHPDELHVATTTNRVHLSGKKKVDSAKVDGRLICHSGKLALLSPAPRAGKVSIKVAPADDVLYYYATLELTDGTLDSRLLKLAPKKDYDWSYKVEGGQATLRVADGATEVASITVPSEKVKGYGFSSTVRWKGNESDLTFTVE